MRTNFIRITKSFLRAASLALFVGHAASAQNLQEFISPDENKQFSRSFYLKVPLFLDGANISIHQDKFDPIFEEQLIATLGKERFDQFKNNPEAFKSFRSKRFTNAATIVDRIRTWTGSHIRLLRDGTTIKADLQNLDDALQKSLRTVFFFGTPEPIPPAEYTALKRAISKDFEGQTITLPKLADTTTNEFRERANPHRKTFAMISPHEVGGLLDERLMQRAKWEAVRHAMENAGGLIDNGIRAEDESGSDRETHTRDRYLFMNGIVYMPDINKYVKLVYKEPLHSKLLATEGFNIEKNIEEHRQDLGQIRRHFETRGIRIIEVQDVWFEGGNVRHLQNDKGNTIFFGMEPWQTPDAPQLLLAEINRTQPHSWNILPVPFGRHFDTKTAKFYHLDLGMNIFQRTGKAIMFPEFTDTDSYARIQEIIGTQNILEIDLATAEKYVTNFNYVGETIVITGSVPHVNNWIRQQGYTIITPDDYGLPTFEIKDGGVNCLTNEEPPLPHP